MMYMYVRTYMYVYMYVFNFIKFLIDASGFASIFDAHAPLQKRLRYVILCMYVFKPSEFGVLR